MPYVVSIDFWQYKVEVEVEIVSCNDAYMSRSSQEMGLILLAWLFYFS